VSKYDWSYLKAWNWRRLQREWKASYGDPLTEEEAFRILNEETQHPLMGRLLSWDRARRQLLEAALLGEG
jgi:hypothetical protein